MEPPPSLRIALSVLWLAAIAATRPPPSELPDGEEVYDLLLTPLVSPLLLLSPPPAPEPASSSSAPPPFQSTAPSSASLLLFLLAEQSSGPFKRHLPYHPLVRFRGLNTADAVGPTATPVAVSQDASLRTEITQLETLRPTDVAALLAELLRQSARRNLSVRFGFSK